ERRAGPVGHVIGRSEAITWSVGSRCQHALRRRRGTAKPRVAARRTLGTDLRGSTAMQPGEAARRARGESEHAPGAGVRAAPRGWRGTEGPGVARGTKEQDDES